MAIAINLFLVQLQNLIPDIQAGEASEANQYQQIKQAVIDYGRIKPETIVSDLTGDGGRYYLINAANLPSYSDEFSRIQAIEYPAQAVSTDHSPVYLGPEDWNEDYYSGGLRYLLLPNHAPAATETMRIRYTGPYLWATGSATTNVTQSAHGLTLNTYVYKNASNVWVSAGDDPNLLATHRITTVTDANTFIVTILAVDLPSMDFFTVCLRAACLLCLEIAARYSRTSDSTISADSVNHPTRAKEFAARAKDFCSKWSEAMGIGGGGENGGSDHLPASEFVDWDTVPGWPAGRRFIFHGNDVR